MNVSNPKANKQVDMLKDSMLMILMHQKNYLNSYHKGF